MYISALLILIVGFSPLHRDSETKTESKPSLFSLGNLLRRNCIKALQFWFLTVLLSLVGSRVSSLIVLEFSLRAVSAWASAGLVSCVNTADGN